MNLELLKKHPYATGGAVIVGGLILFMLLSSSQKSAAPVAAASGASNEGQLLAADLQMQQIQAGVATQSQQNQVQLQTAQLQADTQNQQTAAALSAQKDSDITGLAASLYGTQASVAVNESNNTATTTQQANQLMYAQNMQSMQDSVLVDQINQVTAQNASNNAAMLGGQQITANYQIGIAQLQHDANTVNDLTNLAAMQSNNNLTLATTQIGAGVANTVNNDNYLLQQQHDSNAYSLQQQHQSAVDSQIPYITQHAGQKMNSALDATDQTALFNTILSGGNANVANSGTFASVAAASSGNAASASKFASVAGAISNIGSSIAGGLFA